MAKDSPHFKRWLDLIEINLVGPDGFSLKSTPHDGEPPNQRIDEQAAKILEYNWWKFCTWRDPVTHLTWFDATGRKTAADMDRMNARIWARDGEYFMRIVPAANPYGIAFQALRPDWCDHTYNVDETRSGTTIQCGVEMTRSTRVPLAYWFTTTVQSAMAYSPGGKPIIRIQASEIIHGFTQEDEGQPRGIPLAHASLRKLKMLEQYDIAELTAARDEACSVREYYSDKPQDVESFADLTKEENAATAQTLVAEKEAGQSDILPPGWKSQVTTPQHPNREVTAFKASMLKDVASGFSVEYANFANDWSGVSFSSVRLGTIAERDHWMTMQAMMISQSKCPQYLAWLRSFLTYEVSGSLPLAKFSKFAEHEQRGRRWLWVDPMKDMNANVIAVANKWKTNTDVAADLGNDFAQNVEIYEREQQQLAGDDAKQVPALNGAQITAAVMIIQQYAAGEIAAAPAVALLTAAGVPQDSAQNMVDGQPVNDVDDDDDESATNKKVDK
jgi:lambda family phage portal protein